MHHTGIEREIFFMHTFRSLVFQLVAKVMPPGVTTVANTLCLRNPGVAGQCLLYEYALKTLAVTSEDNSYIVN